MPLMRLTVCCQLSYSHPVWEACCVTWKLFLTEISSLHVSQNVHRRRSCRLCQHFSTYKVVRLHVNFRNWNTKKRVSGTVDILSALRALWWRRCQTLENCDFFTQGRKTNPKKRMDGLILAWSFCCFAVILSKDTR